MHLSSLLTDDSFDLLMPQNRFLMVNIVNDKPNIMIKLNGSVRMKPINIFLSKFACVMAVMVTRLREQRSFVDVNPFSLNHSIILTNCRKEHSYNISQTNAVLHCYSKFDY